MPFGLYFSLDLVPVPQGWSRGGGVITGPFYVLLFPVWPLKDLGFEFKGFKEEGCLFG